MAQGTFLRPIRNKFIEDFITDVGNTSTSYFVTFGKFDEWPTVYDSSNNIISDDNNPPSTNNCLKVSTYDVYRNMLYGKQINETNVAYIIKRLDWTTGTVYDYFDDQDPNLYTKNFYVMNSSKRVYKCLFNNYGASSTVEPTDFNPNGDFVTLPDGYKWKYMYTVTSQQFNSFGTTDYIPVYDDVNVKTFASNGAIHVVIIDNAGANYPYANGTVVSQISPTVVKINPVGADSISGIYKDSSFSIYSGSGNNFISKIDDYVVNSTGNFITTNKIAPFLNSTSYYRIGPSVVFTGDGTDCEAFAYVEPVANSISRVDVVNQGQNYTYATVGFVANSAALGTGGGATARAVISPQKGHGYDTVTELGCDTAVISTEVKDPIDLLPNWATYRQLAVLYNPIASANGTIFLDNFFKQYTTLTTPYFAGLFPTGATVTGLSSGATGTVVYADQANIYITGIQGNFSQNETIYESLFGTTNIAASINTNELAPYSGEIFYYKNIEPIIRYSGSREQIKIYFKV